MLVSGGIKLGGAATFLLNIGAELVRRRIPVQVVSLEHENPYQEDFKRLRIPLFVEDERRKIFEDRLLSALVLIRDFDPTAIVACLGPSSYEVLRYVPNSVTRLAMLQSDASQDYDPLSHYVSFVDAMIGVSRQIERNLRNHPVLRTVPSFYLPYGIPIPRSKVIRAVEPSSQLRVLYLGRLCRSQKRVHLFPEILQQLEAEKVSIHWTIAGDGPERELLQSQMTSTSRIQVKFIGSIPYSGVPGLLDSHDVFLLISDEEGLPISLLEAMSHGLVPVVSDLASGIRDLVDESNGIRVPVSELRGFAAGIVSLDRDRACLQRKAAAAHERVRESYSVEAMTERWLQVLQQTEKREKRVWPARFSIGAPVDRLKSLWFTKPFRMVRRLRLRLSAPR